MQFEKGETDIMHVHLKPGVFGSMIMLVMTGCGSGYGSGSHGASSSNAGSGYGPGASSAPPSSSRGTSANSKTRVTTIDVNGQYAFSPATITVKAGSAVTWSNKSSAPHTVTSDRPGQFNNPLPQGKAIAITFTHAGTYHYHCTYHPYMHGMVVVIH